MTAEIRPWRSVLYLPASNPRALAKARELPADAIIFDLEDAVAPEAKDAARTALRAALEAGGFGHRARIVRINGLDTPWGRDDLAALAAAPAEAVLVPKVNNALDVEAVARQLPPERPVWAMMETPRGIVNAMEIAAHPRLGGMVAGTNDLARELHSRHRPDRLPLMGALQAILLAARAQGVVAIDGVYNAFRDVEGLRAECLQGRDLGFDGKTLIHPAQIAVANEVFGPSPAELDLARRQIAAFEAARAAGSGVAVLDGRIVENLHVAEARALLAKAEAIEKMEREASGGRTEAAAGTADAAGETDR